MLTSWLPKDGRVVGLMVIVPGGGGGTVVAPIPLRLNDWVLLPDSLMATVAVSSVPVVDGVKVTVKLQTTVGGTVCPQVLKLLKSAAFGPVNTMLVMSSAVVPFASVTICGWLEVAVSTGPKFKLAGKSCGPAGVAGAILATNPFVLLVFLRS